MQASLSFFALRNFPLVEPGDDIAQLIHDCAQDNGLHWQAGDVVVLAQKIISKAEDRYAYLDEVEPSAEAIALAEEIDKDPRQMELVLRESTEVIRKRPGVVVVEHRLGYVHANAGIDKSNITSDEQRPRVLLLPLDSDASAEALRQGLLERSGVDMPIIINDSAGRAWRNGTLGFAIGTAGFEPLENRIGDADLFGRELEVTEIAVADELAAGASFLMGQANEGVPVVIVRGASLKRADCGSSSLIRPKEKDMFR